MPLDPKDREYVISSAVDILRHRKRGRLIEILEERLEQGDYQGGDEEALDKVVLALAKAIDRELDPEA